MNVAQSNGRQGCSAVQGDGAGILDALYAHLWLPFKTPMNTLFTNINDSGGPEVLAVKIDGQALYQYLPLD